MRRTTLALLAPLAGLVAALVLLTLAPASAAGVSPAILYVGPGGDCGGVSGPCYASVQDAVDAAARGDEIRVAAGVYTGVRARARRDITAAGVVSQVVYLRKTLTIRGGYSADFSAWNPAAYATTLNAQGLGRGLYITGKISPTIEGLRLTGGNAAGLAGYDYYGVSDAGGGVYVMTATVTLLNNQIVSNRADHGGGVYLGYSASHLAGNILFDNRADTGGGGLFLYDSAATLNGNTIRANTSDNIGGGLYLFGAEALLHGNTIRGNTAQVSGGGLNVASCSPTLSGNVVASNGARKGGGVELWYSASLLTNNAIFDNTASETGAGLWIGGSQPLLLHTTIARNGGGDRSGVVATDAGSTPTELVMTNTVLIDQAKGISVTAGSEVRLDGILWFSTPITVSQAGATVIVENQVVGNPAFAGDGYHLSAGSAALDRGVPAGVRTDIDGQPRTFGPPDLGADEYWPAGLPKVVSMPLIRR